MFHRGLKGRIPWPLKSLNCIVHAASHIFHCKALPKWPCVALAWNGSTIPVETFHDQNLMRKTQYFCTKFVKLHSNLFLPIHSFCISLSVTSLFTPSTYFFLSIHSISAQSLLSLFSPIIYFFLSICFMSHSLISLFTPAGLIISQLQYFSSHSFRWPSIPFHYSFLHILVYFDWFHCSSYSDCKHLLHKVYDIQMCVCVCTKQPHILTWGNRNL